jgi:hypothetical protein
MIAYKLHATLVLIIHALWTLAIISDTSLRASDVCCGGCTLVGCATGFLSKSLHFLAR